MTDKLFQILYEEEVRDVYQEAERSRQEKIPKKRRIDIGVANRMLGHALISVGVSCKDKDQRDKWVDVGKKVLEAYKQ
jgi:hypothetical protein